MSSYQSLTLMFCRDLFSNFSRKISDYCTFDDMTKINVMSSFNCISHWPTFGLLMMKRNSFFYSDLKIVLLVAALASLQRFTFFLLGLSDLDDSAILKFWFEYFQKDSYISKIIVSEKKPTIKLIFL